MANQLRALFTTFSTKRFVGEVNAPESPRRAHKPELLAVGSAVTGL